MAADRSVNFGVMYAPQPAFRKLGAFAKRCQLPRPGLVHALPLQGISRLALQLAARVLMPRRVPADIESMFRAAPDVHHHYPLSSAPTPADSSPGHGAYDHAGSTADGADESADDQSEKPHHSPPHSVVTRADSTQVERQLSTTGGRIGEIDFERVRNYWNMRIGR